MARRSISDHLLEHHPVSSRSRGTEYRYEHVDLDHPRVDHGQAALDVYGHAEVTRWLSPDMDRVPDLAAMRSLLQQ